MSQKKIASLERKIEHWRGLDVDVVRRLEGELADLRKEMESPAPRAGGRIEEIRRKAQKRETEASRLYLAGNEPRAGKKQATANWLNGLAGKLEAGPSPRTMLKRLDNQIKAQEEEVARVKPWNEAKARARLAELQKEKEDLLAMMQEAV